MSQEGESKNKKGESTSKRRRRQMNALGCGAERRHRGDPERMTVADQRAAKALIHPD